jgi:hypothetical protein
LGPKPGVDDDCGLLMSFEGHSVLKPKRFKGFCRGR